MKRPLPNTMRFGSWEGARYRTARVTLGQGNDVVPIRIKHPQRGSVARPVLPVKLDQLQPGAVQATLHRSNLYLADCGRFFICTTARPHEDQDFPLASWKFGQCSTKVLKIDMALLIARDRETAGVHAVAVLCLAGALAKSGIEDVPQDCQQPGPQICPDSKLIRLAPCAQKRFLDKVITGRYRPGKRDSERPQMLYFGDEVGSEGMRRQRACRLARSASRLETDRGMFQALRHDISSPHAVPVGSMGRANLVGRNREGEDRKLLKTTIGPSSGKFCHLIYRRHF